MSSIASTLRAPDERLTADERTPLLGLPDTADGKALGVSANEQHGDTTQDTNVQPERHDDEESKPMPYTQIVLLCFASIIEPISYFAIFPIIGDMLVHTGGLDVKNISLWSGLIEALFSIVQMTVMIAYGKVSDRIGRKPVLVFSLFGIAGASALFGLSQSLWQMVLLRAFTGLFAGSSVTIRAMLSELTTKKTQARAFSWYMFARNLGIFIGPLIGGSLANPCKNIPIFRHNAFFEHFPYSLSMFVTAAICAAVAFMTMIGINETLKTETKGGETQVEPPMTTRQVLNSPGVVAVIYIYGHVMFVSLVYTAVNPVFSYEPVKYGGLGFTPAMISIFVAAAGASQAVWMLGPFPLLQQRYGTGTVLRLCVGSWPVILLINPVLNEMRRHGWEVMFWIVLSVATIVGSGVAMAFACAQLCLNDVAPTPNTLGTLNAIALTVNSAIRSVGPILGTAIYEAGLKLAWIDGHLIWIFIVGLAVALNFGVRYLPPQAEGKPEKELDGEES